MNLRFLSIHGIDNIEIIERDCIESLFVLVKSVYRMRV